MDILESVHKAQDEKMYVEIASCDLSKAFDTVNHILLQQ